jgi:hypothetical protein
MKKRVKSTSLLPIDRLIVLIILALLITQLDSCASYLCGSFDTSEQPEGGPSAYKSGDVVGLNVALSWMAGLNGAGAGGSNSAGRPMYATEDPLQNPFDRPFAAPAAGGGSIRIRPAVEFVEKGSKVTGVTSRLNYLEGIADAVYYYSLPGGSAVYGGLGPFLSYGIGGKTGNGAGKVSSFGGDDGYKRFDAGLNVAAGYELPCTLRIGVEYDLGLYNDSPAPDYTSRNRTFSINVGYSVNKIIGALRRK